MDIKSQKNEIVLNKATDKFEKTSIIKSEMTAEELRNYFENLTQHAKMLEHELDAVRLEIAQIRRLLGFNEREE